ncbi:putative restriction endonuclease [Thioflavicoccus mobilis 8321]|uniref:Putative restriction endonuclease n=2 Tax=Thioflavicoccus mobilis TaxID=80679 RepID=L0GZN0_9GAMM|nr:putative restriction endonuclease [Thioflavicoccus mobilis 8321]
MNSNSSIFDRIDNMRVGKRGERIAPHKPLYLLSCIAALQRAEPRLRLFSDIRDELAASLRLFGGGRSTSVSPQYPFWRLPHDNLADFDAEGSLATRQSNDDPTVASLIEGKARGGLLVDDYKALKDDIRMQNSVIHYTLDKFFPEILHEEIIGFFRLITISQYGVRAADPGEFRSQVLEAYKSRCAVSGFSLNASGLVFGVDAVRIALLDGGKNDSVTNGVTMTPLYHKLFSLGFLAIGDDYRILIADALEDNPDACQRMIQIQGRRIALPEKESKYPSKDALGWHRKWIFKG